MTITSCHHIGRASPGKLFNILGFYPKKREFVGGGLFWTIRRIRVRFVSGVETTAKRKLVVMFKQQYAGHGGVT
jgi:hypothetical protein